MPRFAKRCRQQATLVVASMTCVMGTFAQEAPSDTDSAAALRGQYATLSEQLEQSPIRRGLYLEYLPPGRVLYESGDRLRHIYFPTDCIVSLLHELHDGASAGIATIGNDGVVGVELLTGGESMTNRAVVQSAGFAYQLTTTRLEQEFLRHGELFQLLLGTRRQGVTAAAMKLQAEGIISYRRGQITVLDRCRLEKLSRECYAVVKKESGRLLPCMTKTASRAWLPTHQESRGAYVR